MNPNEIIGLTVGVFSVVAGFTGAIKWLVKHYLSELKPNGGGSMKDKVNNLDSKVDRLESRVDEIYTLLINRP